MGFRNVIWTPIVKEKLMEFRSERYTPEETLGFISRFIKETEDFLKTPIIGKTISTRYHPKFVWEYPLPYLL